MNNLFIDCSLGVSGDMLLAAFIDLGVPLDVIHRPLKILELEEAYSLIVEESKSFLNSNQFRGFYFESNTI